MSIKHLDETQTMVQNMLPVLPSGAAAARNPSAFAASLASAKGREEIPSDPEKLCASLELMRIDMLRQALSIDSDPLSPAPAATSQAIHAFREMMKPSETRGNLGGVTPEAAVRVEAPHPPEKSNTVDLGGIVQTAATRYGVPEGLIMAVIRTESNFNPHAVSRAGAEGLMQLMPATARGLGVSDSFDPTQNIMAGTRFLRDLLRRYDGDLDRTLAAYNWGPANVDRHGCTSLPKETRAYLARVKGYYAEQTG